MGKYVEYLSTVLNVSWVVCLLFCVPVLIIGLALLHPKKGCIEFKSKWFYIRIQESTINKD